MKFNILFSFLLLFFTICLSREKLDDYFLEKAINNLYNYKFEESLNYLDSCINNNSLHPAPYFLKIANNWLYTQTTKGYEASYDMIYSEVYSTIPIYDNLIKTNPDLAEYYLFLGSSYGLMARVGLAKKKWLNVFKSGYKGYSSIQEAKKINPNLYDVYMPIGLMQYFASLSPKPVKWISNFIGIKPDKAVGLENLTIAYNKSMFSWIESGTILIYAYLYFENNLQLAKEISGNLNQYFPNHPYFLYFYSEALLRLNEIELFENKINILKDKPLNYPSFLKKECEVKFNYLMALYYYKINEFEKSIFHCDWVLNNYDLEMDWLLGYTYLLIGKIKDLHGQRKTAKMFYEKVIELDNLFVYNKWAREYIENPFLNIKKDPLFLQK